MIARLFLNPRVMGVLAIFLAVAALYGFGWYQGASSVQERWQAERVEHANVLAKLSAQQAHVTTQVVTEYVDRIKVVREKGKTIVEKVAVYVPIDSCDLPAGFRVLHDAAASGTIPGPAVGADAAAVPASAAAATVAENYSACHQNAEKLRALQLWVSQQESVGSQQ